MSTADENAIPTPEEIKTQENETRHRAAKEKTGFWGERGAGALFYAKKSKRFMLGYRSEEVLQPHTFGTFGGAIDDDEAIIEAITREIVEETGYDKSIELIPLLVFKKGTFSYYNYLAIIEEEFTPTLNWENEDAPWMTLSQVMRCKQLHFGIAHLLQHDPSLKTLSALAR